MAFRLDEIEQSVTNSRRKCQRLLRPTRKSGTLGKARAWGPDSELKGAAGSINPVAP
jgi:hypothetical protein